MNFFLIGTLCINTFFISKLICLIDHMYSAPAPTPTPTSIQTTHTYATFSELLANFKRKKKSEDDEQSTTPTPSPATSGVRLVGCLICGNEIRCTYTDALKHYQSEHHMNIFELMGGSLDDLELANILQLNGRVHITQGCVLRRACLLRVPPPLVVPPRDASSTTTVITRAHLIEKELRVLADIYREQIVDKQIVSWLNSEQFMRRHYDYASYACIICNASKLAILDAHYTSSSASSSSQSKQQQTIGKSTDSSSSSSAVAIAARIQHYSDEMKTVVLTNHVLGHFNEYCYRCMSCKISWPDRTQLLKHAQECSNSQVVRTKTKYKLKANCRAQLKFYLHSYLDYWTHELSVERNNADLLLVNKTTTQQQQQQQQQQPQQQRLDCKVFISDIARDPKLLLDTTTRHNIASVDMSEAAQNAAMQAHQQQQQQLVIEATSIETTTPVPVTTQAAVESSKDELETKLPEQQQVEAVAAAPVTALEEEPMATETVEEEEEEASVVAATEAVAAVALVEQQEQEKETPPPPPATTTDDAAIVEPVVAVESNTTVADAVAVVAEETSIEQVAEKEPTSAEQLDTASESKVNDQAMEVDTVADTLATDVTTTTTETTTTMVTTSSAE